MSELTIVGNKEWCHFDKLNIPAIKARVDSGAKTSSIQATDITTYKKNKENWVRFYIQPLTENRSISIECESKIIATRIIKSSSGIPEKRYVISSPVTMGNETWDIELTLADRDNMEFKMLLGRQAMENRMIVNPSEEFLMGNIPDEEIDKKYETFVMKKSGLKIAVLASNPELYSNKRLMEAGRARGHEMVFLNVQQCYMKLDTATPEIRYRGGNVINDFDAVIPRIKTSMTFYGCALLRMFKSLGTYCLNEAESISSSRDKLFSSQLFSKNDIHIPTTGFAKSPLDTKDLIHMVGGAPLIIKLLESTQGKGVVLAETNKAAESVINAFKSLNANILVQEFIREANGKDLRCFVVDGRVVASIERTAAKGEFRANIHQGGSASIVRISSEEKKLALKSAKILNLPVAGVDLIRSNKGPLLLEVNSSPGLEGIENATGKDIAGNIIQAIEKKLKYVTI
ncbi:30S ribosomal protein S6--L-glutamate ligase [Wenyingzhuangia aestuarii]|uniref:30S ribosomal protein S6--L-glutamate ligase n=1 Tax=Wenyingzhuangia aestuarii TaxID=1647582 RepID=UPI00143B9B2B|nr:30S ribosomal protein S6--L-glutamate ligase [Wenyingzhuangia aestuarii]NJB83982.1 ribosomal protein S6--L-glutamate ligase [Wenyingzhuangia aestuarii]